MTDHVYVGGFLYDTTSSLVSSSGRKGSLKRDLDIRAQSEVYRYVVMLVMISLWLSSLFVMESLKVIDFGLVGLIGH